MKQKKQKFIQQRGFFAAQAFTLQIMQNHGLQNLAATLFAQSHRLGKHCYALAAAQPTIDLPAFIRSFLLTREQKKSTDRTWAKECDIV